MREDVSFRLDGNRGFSYDALMGDKPSAGEYWDGLWRKVAKNAAWHWGGIELGASQDEAAEIGKEAASEAINNLRRMLHRGGEWPEHPLAYLEKTAHRVLLRLKKKQDRRAGLERRNDPEAQERFTPSSDQFSMPDIETFFAYMKRKTSKDLDAWRAFLLLAAEYEPREVAEELSVAVEKIYEVGRKYREYIEEFQSVGFLKKPDGLQTGQRKLNHLVRSYLFLDEITHDEFLRRYEDLVLGPKVLSIIQPATTSNLLGKPIYATPDSLTNDRVEMEKWEDHEVYQDELMAEVPLANAELAEIRERPDIAGLRRLVSHLLAGRQRSETFWLAMALLKASIEEVGLGGTKAWLHLRDSFHVIRATGEEQASVLTGKGYELISDESQVSTPWRATASP
jgi:hypothetical protein